MHPASYGDLERRMHRPPFSPNAFALNMSTLLPLNTPAEEKNVFVVLLCAWALGEAVSSPYPWEGFRPTQGTFSGDVCSIVVVTVVT